MTGRIKELMFSGNGKQVLSLELNEDFRQQFDSLSGREIDIDLKIHREKRSLTANAYFHLLIHKLAVAMHTTDEEMKVQMVLDYGTQMTDDFGLPIGFKLPAEVDPSVICPYTKCFDEREERGRMFKCYLVYKPTHLMNTAEMARLIDGTIYECKEMGIETDTPEEIARLKSLWEEMEKRAR